MSRCRRRARGWDRSPAGPGSRDKEPRTIAWVGPHGTGVWRDVDLVDPFGVIARRRPFRAERPAVVLSGGCRGRGGPTDERRMRAWESRDPGAREPPGPRRHSGRAVRCAIGV